VARVLCRELCPDSTRYAAYWADELRGDGGPCAGAATRAAAWPRPPARWRARLVRSDTEPHRIVPLAPGRRLPCPAGPRARWRASWHQQRRGAGPAPGGANGRLRGIFAGRLAGASHATGGTYASNRPGNLRVGARRRRSSLPLTQSADGRVENVPARGRLTWHQRPGRALDRQWPPASCARAADGSGRREPGWHRGACPGPRPLALRAGPGPLRRAARPAQSRG
jgi:hypothetical protein